MGRIRAAFVAVLLVATVNGVASAQTAGAAGPMNPEAKRHYDAGLKLFSAKSYADAIAELHQADAIDSRTEILFALGQAERLRGNCSDAIVDYNRILSRSAEVEKRGDSKEVKRLGVVRLLVKRCEREMSAPGYVAFVDPVKVAAAKKAAEDARVAKEAEDARAAKDAEDARVAAAARAAADQRAADAAAAQRREAARLREQERLRNQKKWYKDPIGGALAGVGVVALGVGIGLTAHAGAAIANDDKSYADYITARNRQDEQTAGIVLMSVGAASLVGAGVRYYIVQHDINLQSARAAVSRVPNFSFGANSQGGMLLMSGGF